MAKILLRLDNPSEICKKYSEEYSYAVLVDNLSDLDEEGTRMIVYHTKEDFVNGRGCATFPTDSMFDNWFEYDAHFVN